MRRDRSLALRRVVNRMLMFAGVFSGVVRGVKSLAKSLGYSIGGEDCGDSGSV